MTDAARTQQNRDKIASELNPEFGRRIALIIAELEGLGFRPRIQDAWRSPALQLAAFQSGHSKVRWGFHNATTLDGKPDSLAVDLLSEDYPVPGHQHDWPQTFRDYLFAVARAAQRQNLETGITWVVEPEQRAAIHACIDDPTKTYAGELGWDPTHIEPATITTAAARAGRRL